MAFFTDPNNAGYWILGATLFGCLLTVLPRRGSVQGSRSAE